MPATDFRQTPPPPGIPGPHTNSSGCRIEVSMDDVAALQLLAIRNAEMIQTLRGCQSFSVDDVAQQLEDINYRLQASGALGGLDVTTSPPQLRTQEATPPATNPHAPFATLSEEQ